MGNANIVRLPSKEFPQVELINRAIQSVLTGGRFQNSMAFVRYARSREINDYFSSICNVRVIWGGNATIQEIRKSPLPPRAGEITFADRYSICVIEAESYLEQEDRKAVAAGFYNDTYLSDQNACTSPRLVCWVGGNEAVVEAKESFWKLLAEIVSAKYEFQPIQYVDKLTDCCLAAAAVPGVHVVSTVDNQITRIELERIEPAIQDYKGNSGLFYEYHVNEILELAPLCDERVQTVAFLGNRETLLPLIKSGIKGIDRITEIGHTMDFELVWDGYNLAERLTRSISM